MTSRRLQAVPLIRTLNKQPVSSIHGLSALCTFQLRCVIQSDMTALPFSTDSGSSDMYFTLTRLQIRKTNLLVPAQRGRSNGENYGISKILMHFHGKALPHRRPHRGPINVNHFQIFSWSIKPSNLSGFSVFYPQLDMELRPKWFNLCNGFVIFFRNQHACSAK